MMKTPELIYQERFSTGATPRSKPYREGCLALLRYKAHQSPIACPYAPGSPEFDAYWAGHDEGFKLWDRAQAASITDLAIRVMMGGQRHTGGTPMK